MSADRFSREDAKTEQASGASATRGLVRFATHQLLAVLIIVAVLPYLNSLFNGFVQDDNRQVVSNPYLRSFSHLREIFATNVWSYVGAQGTTNYYRPLMTFGYLLCYQFLGPLAYGFHLANVVLMPEWSALFSSLPNGFSGTERWALWRRSYLRCIRSIASPLTGSPP